MSVKQFGAKVSKDHEAAYEQSPNWKDGKFQNLEETSMNFSVWDLPEMIYKQMFNKAGRVPSSPRPFMTFNQDEFLKDDLDFKCI